MGLLGLTTLVGTGASVGRTSPASQPLEAQGPSEAVAGMKHSEECHLLTPPWKFLEVPKFPPGLHLQGLERALLEAQWWESCQEEKGPAIPPLWIKGLASSSHCPTPSSRSNTWDSAASDPALAHSCKEECPVLLWHCPGRSMWSLPAELLPSQVPDLQNIPRTTLLPTHFGKW